jgi:hypothetical protein
MLPIALVLAACSALFFSGDTSDNTEPVPDLPLPPPSPPPPPLPDAKIVPCGISPRLFRLSAQEVTTELQQLFSQAFEVDPEVEVLWTRNPAARTRLKNRMEELQQIAEADPWAAREYNRPEIWRYFNLLKESEDSAKAGYVALERNFVRFEMLLAYHLKNIILPMLENQGDPDPKGMGNLFTVAMSYFDFFAPDHVFSACTEEVNKFLAELKSEPSKLEQILTEASSDELVEIYSFADQFFRDGLWHLDEAEKVPSIWKTLHGQIMFGSNDLTRRETSKMLIWIPLLLSSRGMDANEFWSKTCQVQEKLGVETCSNVAKDMMAKFSAHRFDDADLHYQLRDQLQNLLQKYLHLSLQQRTDPDNRQLVNTLFSKLTEESSLHPLTFNEVDAWIDKIRKESSTAFYPAPLKQNYSANEMFEAATRQGALELRLEDLPKPWQDFYKDTPTPGDPSGKKLWDFLQEYVASVIIHSSPDEKELGTVDYLTRTVHLELRHGPDHSDSDEPVFTSQYIPVLAHETYHIYFVRRAVAQNRKLLEAKLLNERNAYLFEIQVHRDFMKRILSISSGRRMEREKFQTRHFNLFTETHMILQAANQALGFPKDDEEFHYDFPDHVDPKILNQHPAEIALDNFNRNGDFSTNFQLQAQDVIRELISE